VEVQSQKCCGMAKGRMSVEEINKFMKKCEPDFVLLMFFEYVRRLLVIRHGEQNCFVLRFRLRHFHLFISKNQSVHSVLKCFKFVSEDVSPDIGQSFERLRLIVKPMANGWWQLVLIKNLTAPFLYFRKKLPEMSDSHEIQLECLAQSFMEHVKRRKFEFNGR
jgi:hypothetical protein